MTGRRTDLVTWSPGQRLGERQLASLLLALAIVGAEQPLAQPEALGRDLDELIVADVLDRVVEAQDARSLQPERLLRRGRADIGQVLALADVHLQVAVANVLADDHAFIDLYRRHDEELPALLGV